MTLANVIFEKRILGRTFQTLSSPAPFPTYRVKQVHGNNILKIEEGVKNEHVEADGMYMLTQSADDVIPPLAILTADWLPISLIGKFGVAHLHAGWRGLQQQIIQHEILQQIEVQAAIIGPHIRPCCYEVGDEFYQHFANRGLFIEKEGKIYLNMEQEAITQIQSSYGDISIERDAPCTCCQSEFHSYRQNGTALRNWNILL